MHPKIAAYFTSLKHELKAKHSKSAILDAPTTAGTVRENFCSVFLREFLPADVSITSGEVIDSFGNQAKAGQQDIVLYDPKVMKLNMDNNVQVLLVEGCLATIEVKSTLTKDHFFLALDKCREFKKLELSLFPLLPERANVSYSMIDQSLIARTQEVIRIWKPNIETFIKPKFYIFAYTGPAKMETLAKWLDEYYQNHAQDYYDFAKDLPDLVCVLDLGLVYRNNGFAFKLQPFFRGQLLETFPPMNDPIFLEDTEMEVVSFAGHLLEAVRLTQRNSRLQAMGLSLNLKRYYTIADLLQEGEIIERHPRDLAGINASREDLSESDLSGNDFTMADFSNGDLQGSDLSDSFFGGTIFVNANLQNCDMSNAILVGADLRGADLRGTDLSSTTFENIQYDERTQWPEGFNISAINQD